MTADNTLLYPKKLNIETYHGCNANCSICSISRWKRKQGPMSEEIFEKVIHDAVPFKDSLVVTSLYSCGEPLLDKRMGKRIRRCREVGLPNVGFSTNAELLTDQRSRELLDAGMDWITISLDSIEAPTYRKIKGRLDLKGILDNIHRHIENRNAISPGSKVNIRFIEQRLNQNEFPGYLGYWESRLNPLGGDEIQRQPLNNWARGNKNRHHGTSPCGRLWDQCVVDSDGNVILCCSDFNATESAGNVMKTDLVALWNSEFRNAIRDIHSRKERQRVALCSTCDIPELLPLMTEYPRMQKGKRVR